MKTEYYKWFGVSLFVFGFLIGSLLFPLPRYKPMASGEWVMDTWTGKIESYADQQKQP
jgi:hypothetical protein